MSGFPLYVLGATNTTDNVEGLNGFKKTGYTDAYFLLAGGGQTPVANYLPVTGGNITGGLTIQGNTVATQSWVTSQGYITNAALSNYVTTDTPQNITGDKTFQGALQIETGQMSFYDAPNDTWGKIQLLDNEWLFENGGYSFARFEIGGKLTLYKTNSIGAIINPQILTAPRLYNLPNTSGTIALQEWVTSQGYASAASLGDYISGLHLSSQSISDADAADNKGVQFNYLGGTNKPTGSVDGSLLTMSYSQDYFSVQLYGDWRTKDLFIRTQEGNVWKTWAKFWHSDNFNPTQYVTTNTTQTITASKTFIGNTYVQPRFAVKGNDGNDWIVLHGGVRKGVIKNPDNISQEVVFIGWTSSTDYQSLGNFPYFGFNHPSSRIVIRFNLDQHTDKALAVGGPSYIESISTQSHGDSAQWKQAHDWGNHGSVGYIKQSELNNEIIYEAGEVRFTPKIGLVDSSSSTYNYDVSEYRVHRIDLKDPPSNLIDLKNFTDTGCEVQLFNIGSDYVTIAIEGTAYGPLQVWKKVTVRYCDSTGSYLFYDLSDVATSI